jgi:hypothetical protein
MDEPLLGLRVQMFAGDGRIQGLKQAAAPHDPLKAQVSIFAVQLEGEIGRQDEPTRHLLLLAGRGHRLRQGVEHFLLQTELEELFLIGLPNHFQFVKLTGAKGLQDALRMGFDEGDIHETGGQGTM